MGDFRKFRLMIGIASYVLAGLASAMLVMSLVVHDHVEVVNLNGLMAAGFSFVLSLFTHRSLKEEPPPEGEKPHFVARYAWLPLVVSSTLMAVFMVLSIVVGVNHPADGVLRLSPMIPLPTA